MFYLHKNTTTVGYFENMKLEFKITKKYCGNIETILNNNIPRFCYSFNIAGIYKMIWLFVCQYVNIAAILP